MNSDLTKYFSVIYEDNHLLIVNKSSGILVQGEEAGDLNLVDQVKEHIKIKYEKPGEVFLGVIHRLDRPVSGVVVFARTSKALKRMNELFRKREVQKTYWAVVKNKPPEEKARLVHWLKKDDKNNKAIIFHHPEDQSWKAELTYRVLGYLNDHYLLEIQLHTGRYHQIRAQLAGMGCPIRGDVKYGFPKNNPDKSINLHARKIYFTHPVKNEPVLAVAGLPVQQFWEQFLALENSKIKDKNLDYLY